MTWDSAPRDLTSPPRALLSAFAPQMIGVLDRAPTYAEVARRIISRRSTARAVLPPAAYRVMVVAPEVRAERVQDVIDHLYDPRPGCEDLCVSKGSVSVGHDRELGLEVAEVVIPWRHYGWSIVLLYKHADTHAVHGWMFTEAHLIGRRGGLYDWSLYSWRFREERRLDPMEDEAPRG